MNSSLRFQAGLPVSAVMRTPKRLGEWVELQFCSRTVALGFATLRPWGDSCRYDCVVGDGSKFSRVQVRGTTFKSTRSGYRCRIVSGNNRGVDTRYTAAEIDFFAAYIIPANLWFIIPVAVIERLQGQFIYLNPNPGCVYQHFMENWDLLRNNTAAAGMIRGQGPDGEEGSVARP